MTVIEDFVGQAEELSGRSHLQLPWDIRSSKPPASGVRDLGGVCSRPSWCAAGEFSLDFGAAFGGTHDDAVGAKLLLVVGEGRDANRDGAEEAMAAGDVAGRDAAEGELERLATEQGDDPADRADEAGAVEAGPSHGARPGKVVDRAGEDFG